jgi:hypothetical protein
MKREKTIVFHRDPESFGPGKDTFSGPGMLMKVYDRKYAIVYWMMSGKTACHDIDHVITEVELLRLRKEKENAESK